MKREISGDVFARFGVEVRIRDFLRYLMRLVGKVALRGGLASAIPAMTPR